MADIPRPETIGAAMKLESQPTVARAAIPVGNPEYRANQVLKVREEAGSKEAIRVAAHSEVPQESIDALKVQIKDPATRVAFTEQANRLKTFIETGTLTGADKIAFIAEFRKMIDQYPPLHDTLGSPGAIEAYAQWLFGAQHGTLSPEMYQRLEVLLKSQPPSSETDLQKLKGEVDKKKAEKKIVDDDKRIAEENRKKWIDEVDSFATGTKKTELATAKTNLSSNTATLSKTDSDIASKQTELDSLKTAKEAIEAKGITTVPTEMIIDTKIFGLNSEIADLTTKYPTDPSIRDKEYTRLTAEISQLNSERAFSRKYGGKDLSALTGEISKAEKKVTDLKTKKKDLETEIGKVEKLEAEEKKAREEVQKAGKAFLEAEAKLAESKAEVTTAETAYNEAKRKYDAWEKDLVNKSKSIVGEAAAEWINKEAEKLEKAIDTYYSERVKKEEDDTKSKLRRKVTELITDEKDKKVKGKEVKYRVTSKDKVFNQAQKLLNEGPDKLIEDFCISAGIDPNEIAKMQADPELRNDIISEVLGRHMVANGILPQQIEQIKRSSWGKDMVQKALDANDSIKADIEKALGAGVLESSFWDKFWHTVGKNRWLLLLILGGATLAGMAVAGPLGGGAGWTGAGGLIAAAGGEAIGVGRGASKMGPLEELGI